MIVSNLVNEAAILVFVCSKSKLDVLSSEIRYLFLFRQKNFKSVKYGEGGHLQNFSINQRKLDRFSVIVSTDTLKSEPKKVQSYFYILSVAFELL